MKFYAVFMLFLLSLLLFTECGCAHSPFIAFGQQCEVPPFHSVTLPVNQSCARFTALTSLAQSILHEKFDPKTLSTLDVYVIDRDIFVMQDGNRVLGYFDKDTNAIAMTRSESALLHEILHAYDELVLGKLALDEKGHTDWDKMGYYTLDQEFESRMSNIQ